MYLPPQVACSTLYVATDFVCFPGRAYACMHMALCRLPHHTYTPDAASRIPRNQQKKECLTRARSPNIRPSTNPGVSISPAPTHHAPFRSSAGIRRASHAATAQTPVIMESLRPRSCLPACLSACRLSHVVLDGARRHAPCFGVVPPRLSPRMRDRTGGVESPRVSVACAAP